MPRMCRSKAAWCSLHRASPFVTIGSPPSASLTMWAASTSSARRSRHTAQQGAHDRLPEAGLVHPRTDDLSPVRPRGCVRSEVVEVAGTEAGEVEAELPRIGAVLDHVGREERPVAARDHAEVVDEG